MLVGCLADLILLPAIYTERAFMVTILAIILSRAYLIAEQARGGAPVPAGGVAHQ